MTVIQFPTTMVSCEDCIHFAELGDGSIGCWILHQFIHDVSIANECDAFEEP